MSDSDKFWEKRYALDKTYRNKFPYSQVVSFLAKNKRDEFQRLLELGCGSGNNLLAAAEFGYECHGIDISQTIIDYAKTFLEERSIYASLQACSFEDMKFPDKFFDIVIDRGATCCASLNNQALVIDKVFQFLRPGGVFYFNPLGEVNSSKLIEQSFPTETITRDNPYNGTIASLVYYDESAIRNAVLNFDILEITKNIKYIKDSKGVSHSYSDYEVICKKPIT